VVHEIFEDDHFSWVEKQGYVFRGGNNGENNVGEEGGGDRCENNAAVVLTKHSGGVSNKGIRHKVVNCDNSFSICLELAKQL